MTEAEWVAINIAGGITLGTILQYFGLSGETIIILTVMLLLDRVFGVADAYIQGNLQSKLMATGILKKWTRWLLPFIIITAIKWAGLENADFIGTAIVSILIVAECYSIIWHIYSINYKEQLTEMDALKLLLQRIAKVLKWKVEETLPPKEEDEWNDNTELQEQI